MSTDAVVKARELRKRYGDVVALDGVDLEVRAGEVFGLLGPNGAGKTTTVKTLTTLQRADSGTASVLGHDVAGEPARVRALIGYVPQELSGDRYLTAREHLAYFCDLYHLRAAEKRARIGDLLELLDLAAVADRPIRTFSGGMKKKLDLACGLVHRPRLLFLDEPTTGLDPQARMSVWDLVDGLRAEGLGVVLTTHYMEEAERLSDALLVLAQGRVVAHGPPKTVLGDLLGEHVVVVDAEEAAARAAVAGWLAGRGLGPPAGVLGQWHVPLRAEDLADFARAFPDLRYEVRAPTLDDLFLKLSVAP
jgi:ABC-type multidrug transport system ATPase subunit